MENTPENADNKKALTDFLLDIDCLKPLARYTSGVNVFDVLKISKTEIRHSNMLAWLLNPNENHGLGDQFLRSIFQCLIVDSDTLTDDQKIKILTADFNKFIIQREHNNIDLLLSSTEDRIVLCIENKIDTNEHDNQLQRYRDSVAGEFPATDGWLQIFVFLTPEGRNPSDPQNWLILPYKKIADVLQDCLDQNELVDDSRMILVHYLKTIRRDIIMDNELVKICKDIYAKHQKALDLIFDNREDLPRVVYGIVVEWCESQARECKIKFQEEDSNKSYIRFSTEKLEIMYPLLVEKKSGWGNAHSAFYEINNTKKKIIVRCSVSAKNLDPQLVKNTRSISNSDLKEEWAWKTIFSRRSLTVVNSDDSLIEKKKIYDYLNESLNEIEKFEEETMKELGLAAPDNKQDNDTLQE